MIEKTTLGNGIERVTYELNPALALPEPDLARPVCHTPKCCCRRWNASPQAGNRPREPMDRHIAAFLIVRDRRSEVYVRGDDRPEGSIRRGVALLTCSPKCNTDTGPNLCRIWRPGWRPSLNRPCGAFWAKSARAQQKTDQGSRQTRRSERVAAPDRRPHAHRTRPAGIHRRAMLYLNIQKEIVGLENQAQQPRKRRPQRGQADGSIDQQFSCHHFGLRRNFAHVLARLEELIMSSIPVPSSVAAAAWIDEAAYQRLYAQSIHDPENFWREQAGLLDWFTRPTKILSGDFSGDVTVKWFEDGALNAAHNCIDRHLSLRADQTAIIWEPDGASEPARHIS